MDAVEYAHIQGKVRKLHEHVSIQEVAWNYWQKRLQR